MSKKPIPRFTALLPVLLSRQEQRVRISKAEWDKLPPAQRDYYHNWSGDDSQKCRTVYRRIEKLAPFPNPDVTEVITKLKRQRLVVYTAPKSVNGIAFVEITTINPFS